MRGQTLLASLAIHAIFLGAVVATGWSPSAPEQDSGSVPIYFEVIEAASLDAAEPDSGPVPNETAGSVPNQENEEVTGSVPMDSGSVPQEDLGSVPMWDDALMKESREKTAEIGDIEWRASEDHVQPEEFDPSEDEDWQETGGENLVKGNVSPEVAQEERARVVSAPIALNRIVPVYPRSARRKGHEGSVMVEISVAEDGRIAQAEVVMSSGYAELDAAALGAVRTARFAPATEDGVSVRGELRLTFDFRLR